MVIYATSIRQKEKGVMYFDDMDKQRMQRRLVERLERMGYQVILHPQSGAA
jgi:hypothetical protein